MLGEVAGIEHPVRLLEHAASAGLLHSTETGVDCAHDLLRAAVYEATVEYHLGNIYGKLGVRSRQELRRLRTAP